jgi:hypothetical protein
MGRGGATPLNTAGSRPKRSPARSRPVGAQPSKAMPAPAAARHEGYVAAGTKATKAATAESELAASLKWWSKYLIVPLTWALASFCGKDHLMPSLMGGSALRYVVALVFTALSKLDSVAEPVRIIRGNPPARQHERELDWDGPIILVSGGARLENSRALLLKPHARMRTQAPAATAYHTAVGCFGPHAIAFHCCRALSPSCSSIS